MPIPNINQLPPDPSFGDVTNRVNRLVQELTELLLNLDSLNVVSITAGTLIVYDLDGGPGTITINANGMVINNGTTDTFVVDINGNVTMTSALVRSAAGFPRVELNSVNTLLSAYNDPNNHVDISPNAGGAPGLAWTVSGVFNAFFQSTIVGPLLTALSGTSITLQASGGNINLTIGNNLNINGSNGQTGTVYAAATPGGVPNIPITFTKGIRTT